MFDLHVHAAPDVIGRIGDDNDICQMYAESEFSGFVLKGHHESTVGRAASLAKTSGLDVVGGIALNKTVGGVNPATVVAALGSGGRVVWFPTADCHTQETAALPRLSDLDARLDRAVLSLPPVLVPDTQQAQDISLVLDLIAEYDAVLCTGHVSTAECRWLLDEAQKRGIKRFLLTHPSYTVPGMSISEIAEFAERGAHVEITAFQMWHQPGMTTEYLAQVAKAAGSKLVLASDAGQPNSPQPPVALKELVSALSKEGLDERWLLDAASTVPRSLVLK